MDKSIDATQRVQRTVDGASVGLTLHFWSSAWDAAAAAAFLTTLAKLKQGCRIMKLRQTLLITWGLHAKHLNRAGDCIDQYINGVVSAVLSCRTCGAGCDCSIAC
jgi:hypothetical protein